MEISIDKLESKKNKKVLSNVDSFEGKAILGGASIEASLFLRASVDDNVKASSSASVFAMAPSTFAALEASTIAGKSGKTVFSSSGSSGFVAT